MTLRSSSGTASIVPSREAKSKYGTETPCIDPHPKFLLGSIRHLELFSLFVYLLFRVHKVTHDESVTLWRSV